MASRQKSSLRKRENQDGIVATNPIQQQASQTASNSPESSSDAAISGNPQRVVAAAAATTAQGSGPRPIRRRMRMITSCLECRRRKLKCCKSQPCANCARSSRECHYLGPKLDEAGLLRLTEIKDKVGSLEHQLERDVATATASTTGSAEEGLQRSRQQRILADDVAGDKDPSDALDLEPLSLALLDMAYDDDDVDDATGEILDLGVKVGKMRITDRVSGLSRPKLAEEISAGIAKVTGSSSVPLSIFANSPQPDLASASWPDYLLPGSTYIPPASGLYFGQNLASPSLEALLPSRGAADRLIQQYFQAVHPVARCVHKPSFESDYEAFWSHVHSNIEPRATLQALVFAAMFAGAVSMDGGAAARDFGMTHKKLYEALKLGTETALTRANFLRTTRVQTMQAFVVYMVTLCRDEVSRAHSALVGAAIRLAEGMGLHRDGETYGLNPLDTHVRRLLWHQLCFLDIRTCEAQGPRPIIRRDDYDTLLPLNCDEEQLSRSRSELGPAGRWTMMMLPLIRFEINEMMRIIWLDRRLLEGRRITLTEALTRVKDFRGRMLAKYDHLLDNSVPIQRYARLVMNLHIYRLHAMILTPFYSTVGKVMPPDLVHAYITTAIMVIEIGVQLEADPAFQVWRWYSGAYHQFHASLALVVEAYMRPNQVEADRIWACLDYVYDTDRTLPRQTRALQILHEVMEKTSMYQRMRRSRRPPHSGRTAADEDADYEHNPPLARTNVPGQRYQDPTTTGPTATVQTATMMPDLSYQGMQALDTYATNVPPQNAVYAGISDGQILWSVNTGNGFQGGTEGNMQPEAMVPSDPATQINVDWDAMGDLFTTDPVTGEINISGYGDPTLSMDWQQWG